MQKYNWTEGHIRQLLLDNNKALIRGLIRLWHEQTPDERQHRMTIKLDHKGFNPGDAPKLSFLAEKASSGQDLTEIEWRDLRKRMLKYAGQLLRLSKSSPKP